MSHPNPVKWKRIWSEFRKGCVDTQVKGTAPESCNECLEAAIRAMDNAGLTNRDSAISVLTAKNFSVSADRYHVIDRSEFR